MAYDIDRYPARSGRIIGEDGQLYNLVDLLQNAGGGGGGGMRFHFGSGAPDASLGAPGDVYLNTSNGDFYLNQNGTWNQIGNLRGPQGPEGPEGDQGPAGVGIEDITSDGENITFHLTDGIWSISPGLARAPAEAIANSMPLVSIFGP